VLQVHTPYYIRFSYLRMKAVCASPLPSTRRHQKGPQAHQKVPRYTRKVSGRPGRASLRWEGTPGTPGSSPGAPEGTYTGARPTSGVLHTAAYLPLPYALSCEVSLALSRQ